MSTQPFTDQNNIPEPIILRGGRDWTVKLRDGTSKEIFIRKQPFLEMEKLAKVWGQMKGEALCYSGLEEKELTQLTDSSVAEILKEGRALNFLSLSEYFSLQEQTMNAYGQDVKKLSEGLASELRAKIPAPA